MTIEPIEHIAARAVAGSGHRAKKTAAFKALEPTIIASLTRGSSIKSLYRELKKDGHNIGSEAWFRTLIKRLNLKSDGQSVQTAEARPTVDTPPPAKEPVSRAFGDARFSSDY